jgi:PEP-CTERM motif-containing protein
MSGERNPERLMMVSRSSLIPNFIKAFCSLVAATGLSCGATVFNFNETIDLSNPAIYVTSSSSTKIVIPLSVLPGSAYRSGDTLNVTLGFQGSQRLLLTANPTGQDAPTEKEGIGIHIYDSTMLRSEMFGSLRSSMSLTDPLGAYFLESASAENGFAAARGALTRFFNDWTDTSFSVVGFEFQIAVLQISQIVGPQEVLPNEIAVEFREFQLQPIPEPTMGLLWLAALGFFAIARRREFRSRFIRRLDTPPHL